MDNLDKVYSGRDGYTEINVEEAHRCLIKPFPDDCEIKKYVNGELAEYKLRIQALLQKKCAYQELNSDIITFSPPDNLCLAKALATLAYYNPTDPSACHAAFAAAQATVEPNTQGHGEEKIA
jgi:hypothetical protein